MKKYFLLSLLAVFVGCATLYAADYAELLKKLDGDYQKSLKTDTWWQGTTRNPNSHLDVFKARDEIRNLKNAAFGSDEKIAEINAFFVDALKKDIRPETKVWILEQLAGIGTAKEVPVIAELLKSDNRLLKDAAVAALVLIPGSEAEVALKDCAYSLKQKTVAKPAYMPNETKMPMAIPYVTEAEVEAWMANYDKLDELVKAQTLAALAVRNNKKYNAVAVAAMNSDSEILQKAGFFALEKLATKDDVPALLAWAKKDRGVVIRICSFIVADGFDEALIAILNNAKDADDVLMLTEILARRATDIRAIIFAKTTAEECPNRLALMQQITRITTPADTEKLVASALRFPLGAERDAAENLIASCLAGNATPVVALIGKYNLEDLFSIIGRIGGAVAMAEVNKGLASTDASMRQATIRALQVWPNAKFADQMFAVATDDVYTADQKVSALRSFIRVISLPDNKIGISISRDGKLEKLQAAFKIATRVEEKRLILSRLAANRTVKSLQFAVSCASDKELAESAYAAIADHAHDNVLRQQNMEVFGPAMELVIHNSSNKDLVERVKRYKNQK